GIGGPPRRRVGGRAAGGALRAGATAAGASGAGPGRRRVPIARAPPRLARRNAMAGRRPSPLLAFALLALAAFRAGAEPPPAKPAKPAKDWEDWEVELLAYGWLPAVDGSLERPNGRTEHFSMGALDLLEDLELGAMGRASVRWRRWLVLVDGLWTKLDQGESVQRNRLRIDAD